VTTLTQSAGEAPGPATDEDVERSAAPTGPDQTSTRAGAAMLLLGAVGLLASVALTVERVLVAMDPTYIPSCSLNPILTCTAAMLSEQGSLFGLPNSLLGVAAFPVLMTTGAALLAGARMRPWFWTGALLGAVLGVVFVHVLVATSLWSIEALCPYCMVVWTATIPLFAVVGNYGIPRGALGRRAAQSQLVGDLLALRWWLVGLWFAVVVALAGVTFWDYWSSLL
jgi:uncharacterized membrane protein